MSHKSIINFGKYETASVLINVFIIKIFLGLPWELAKNTGTAGWIVSIISGTIFFAFLYFILRIYEKNEQFDVFELSEMRFGKKFKAIFAIIVSLSFLVKGSLCLFVTSDILVTVLPFNLPGRTCMLLLLFSAFITAWRGLEGIVRLHAIFLPFVALAFLFTVIVSFFHVKSANIFPILGFGVKNIAYSSLKYVGIYSDIIYVFLLAPHVKNKKIYKKACLGATIISAFLITAVIFSYNYAIGYPMGEKLLMPIYQVSRLLKTGANSQGFEAFLLPEWIISSLLYVSLSVYFASSAIENVLKITKNKILILISAVLTFLLTFIPNNLPNALHLGTKYVNIFIILVSFASIIICILAGKAEKRL